jgi:starch synthase
LPIAGGINSDGSKAAEKPMHVMSVAVEMAPIAKVGGLGDVVTSLSLAVEAEGHRVEVVLPKYDCMKYDLIDDLKEEKGFEWGGTYNHVYSGTVEGVKTFFIDPDNGMFKVGMVYGTDYLSIPMTDQERFGFFSKAALEWMLQSGRNPDIIHIHDWQTAPVAKFLAEDYAPYGLDNPKVIFTIHNLHYGQALIADAMNNCSIATTVSRTYAKEIAHEGCVNPNLHKLHGVVNGIDPDIWDPRNDKFLPQFFGEDEVIPGKAAARQALCSRSNLYNNPEVPMIGVVTRLTHQKGIHLIKRAIYRALERGCQVCLLGSAPDEKVQKEFEEMAHQLKQEHYNTAALHLFYDETMSHFIYSGADMILVPSMFEPCGLSQLIAMRYGTVPVVRRTGGLADTVFDVEHDHAKAAWEGMTPNGFSFDGTDEGSIDYALDRGIDMFYNDIDVFRKLQANCMSQDWSWNRPAIEYIELFHAARKA